MLLQLRQEESFTVDPHDYDLVITHGDDTDHSSHWVVRASVEKCQSQRVIHTSRTGPIAVPIDWPAKLRLLEHYRYGTTRTPEWRPQLNPRYEPWCGPVEHFTADPGVVEWWRTQFPDLAGGGAVDCGTSESERGVRYY